MFAELNSKIRQIMASPEEDIMPAKKAPKTKPVVTVLVGDKIGDGKGGYFAKGDTFEPGSGCDVQGLKDRGLAE